MEKEIFMIYAKKSASDTIFDYKTTAKDWEECTEILERIAKKYESVKYLHIVDGREVCERTFNFSGTHNKTVIHKKTGGVISLQYLGFCNEMHPRTS